MQNFNCPATADGVIALCPHTAGSSQGRGWALCKNGSWYQAGLAQGQQVSGSGRCSCFTAETMVAMADGSEKEIHTIKGGDQVRAPNGGVNTVIGIDRTLMWKGKKQHLIRLNGEKEFMTDNHPVMTVKGWKALVPELAEREAYDILSGKVGVLEVGDQILLADGKVLDVKSIEIVPQEDMDVRLYNLQLDGDHGYYANGLHVHGVVPDLAGRFMLDNDHEGEGESR